MVATGRPRVGHTGGMPSEHEAEFEAAAQRALERLETRLPTLVRRGVPLRSLTPGPVTGTARVRLADSTTLLVGSSVPGDVSRVLRALATRRSVTLRTWDRTDEGLVLELAGVPGREPPRLVLLGPDQPD